MQEKQNIMNVNKQNNNNENSCSSSNSNWIRGKCIGKGSFATVNIALNTSTNTLFALKSVPLNNPTQKHHLQSEIQILKNISSPYIVTYLNHDLSQTHLNLHLEYLPQGDLASRASLNLPTTRHFTRCLLNALSYLHSKNIVHCDVKGKNVLLHGNSVKLADFGSAKKMDSIVTIRGSPLWMAPEVVRGEYQGPESDVWSLGCTVIEMVKGKPAWDFGGFDELRRVGDCLPDIPEGFCEDGRDFLEKCLRMEKSERWSCEELLRHPFVNREESPRCVFDLDFDVVEEFECGTIGVNSEVEDFGVCGEVPTAGGRIGRLDCGGGVNWVMEEGWIDVRGTEVLSSGYSNFGGILAEENIRGLSGFQCSEDGGTGEGTSREFCCPGRAEEEDKMVFSEFRYLEVCGGSDCCEGTECAYREYM